jgi:hypothetical protein
MPKYTREELERLIPLPSATRTYPSPADHRAMLLDWLRLSNGQRVNDPEPLAREWAYDGRSISEVRDATGLTASDFSGLMDEALGFLMAEQFGDTATGIAAITRTIELPNYKKASLAQVGIAAPAEIVEDLAPTTPRLPFEVGTDTEAALREFGGRVSFSRPLWMSYSAEIAQAVGNYGATFGLLEAQLLAEVLEAGNPDTIAGVHDIDVTNLEQASAALRNQLNASNQKCNHPLSAILCPPIMEVSAYKVRRDTGMDFQVVANPYLSSTTAWYAFGPATASPLVRLVLRGGGKPKLYGNPRRKEQGAEFAVEHSVNFLLLSAPGVVKL